MDAVCPRMLAWDAGGWGSMVSFLGSGPRPLRSLGPRWRHGP